MTLGVWQNTIVNALGEPITDVDVTVRLEIAGQPLASVYEDRAGTIPLGNPFNASDSVFDGDGFVRFYAAGGFYRLDFSADGFSQTLRHVPIGLAQGSDGLITGLGYRYKEETTAQDPTSGFFSLDSNSIGQATTLRLDNRNDAGVDVSALIDAWDSFGQSSDRGTLYLQRANAEAFLAATLTGTISAVEDTDGEGYRELSITPIAQDGEFAVNGLCFLIFVPSVDASGGLTFGQAISAALVFG